MDTQHSAKFICQDFLQTSAEQIGPVQLVFCDIFDNIGTKYSGFTDKMPEHEYYHALDAWIVKCCGITDGPVFFTFNERWIGAVEEIIRHRHLLLKQRLWWTWTFGQCQRLKYTPAIRPIYWLNSNTVYPEHIRIPSARQERYNDKRAKTGGKMPDNVWSFPRICGTYKERRAHHPCQIPETIVERIVKGHTLPGDSVLDPCIGSGTTAIVCNRINRSVVGIDISPDYISRVQELIRGQDHG